MSFQKMAASLFLTGVSLTFDSQQISKEELVFLTPEWKGERLSDGRPSFCARCFRTQFYGPGVANLLS